MNITNKQRKAILICLGIVVASYFVRSIANSAMQMANYQQQAARVAQQRQAKMRSVAVDPSNASAQAPSPFGRYSGIWLGRAVLEGRGVVNLTFELRESEPGRFTGYSTFTAVNPQFFMNPKDGNVLKSLNPDSAIMTGTVQKGSIQFKVDKAIGTDPNGCAVSAFTLTPFGAFLAAEWQSGTCQGGHMLLQKERP